MAEKSTTHALAVATASLPMLTAVEALALLLWAPLHLGVEISLGFAVLAEPRIVPAFVVESLCGLALAVSAFALATRKHWAWRAAFGAHLSALGGVLLGMTALALGGGPRTVSNDLYHIVMVVLLVAGLLLLCHSTRN